MIYLLIAVVAGPLLISLASRSRFHSIYEKAQKFKIKGGLTGAGMARRILEAEQITDVEIVEHWGLLPDHYDPERKRLSLARPHFRGTDAAALGIAAHEAGHAIQHRRRFAPLKMRQSAIKCSQYLTPIVVLVPMLMIFAKAVPPRIGILLLFGGWAAILGFNLFTLPVEYDASERAKEVLYRKRLLKTIAEERATYSMMRGAALMYVSGVVNVAKWLIGSIVARKGGPGPGAK